MKADVLNLQRPAVFVSFKTCGGSKSRKVSHTFNMCFDQILINLLGFNPPFSIQKFKYLSKGIWFPPPVSIQDLFQQIMNQLYNTMEEGHWKFSLHQLKNLYLYTVNAPFWVIVALLSCSMIMAWNKFTFWFFFSSSLVPNMERMFWGTLHVLWVQPLLEGYT